MALTNTDKLRVRIARKNLEAMGGEVGIQELAEACFVEYDRSNVEGWVGFIKQRKAQKFGGYSYSRASAVVMVTGPAKFNLPAATVAQETLADMASSEGEGVRLYIPNGDSHIPVGVPEVVMTKGTRIIWDALDIGMATEQPVAFIGPKGVAKTLAVQKWCEDKGMPMLVYDCSEETEPHHFEGQWAESEEGIMFVGGIIIQAYHLANKHGFCVVVMEELNALTGFTQKRLNSLLDWRKNWYVPQLSRTFSLRDGAKILFVACMNPTGHGGVHELNEDFKSRWSCFNIQYPNKVEEQSILEGVLRDVPEVAGWFHKFITLADETRQGDKSGLTYALSPRDVVRLIRNFAYATKLKGENRALELCKREFAAMFPEDEVVTAKLRFAAVLGGSVADDDDE